MVWKSESAKAEAEQIESLEKQIQCNLKTLKGPLALQMKWGGELYCSSERLWFKYAQRGIQK